MKPSETDWNAVFQCNDYLYFYASAISEETTLKQVDFITDKLQLPRGATLLDIACGHGRHANSLAQKGYKVTGIDVSRDFLTLARTQAEMSGLQVEYLEQDMRDINFENRFDGALSLFTSFGYCDHVRQPGNPCQGQAGPQTGGEADLGHSQP